MHTDSPLYIAETDDRGAILCVWYSRTKGRQPRPINNPIKHLSRVISAQHSGAGSDEIIEWVRAKAAAAHAV